METRQSAEELVKYLAAIFRSPKANVHDITRGEIAVLFLLCLNESAINPTELSREAGLSTARIANTLNSLEKKKYIERSHDLKDRRKIVVNITDNGRAFAMARYEDVVESLQKMLEVIGEEDTVDLLRISKKLSDYLPGIMLAKTLGNDDSGTAS